MLSKQLLPVLAAAGSALAQTTCTTTTTVNSAAEATSLGSSCSTVKGDVIVSNAATGVVDFGSLKQITGALTVENNGNLVTLQANNLGTIGGQFLISNVSLLSTLSFQDLTSVGSISWKSLAGLSTLSFSTGLSKVTNGGIEISDTHLTSLSGINVQTLTTLAINNNARLTDLTLALTSLSDTMVVNANNEALVVSLPNLAWIANLTVQNVKSLTAPSLVTVNGSIKLDTNYFETFSLPNLTSTKSGDIAFVGNDALDNITFPVLTSIGGGLLVANNTQLVKLDAFNKVKTIGGAVKLRGNFTELDFSAITDIKGAFDASSTDDMDSSCNTLKALSGTGGGHPIEGTFSCTSKNATANTDTSGNTSGTSGGSGTTNNTAAGVHINTALLGLAVVGGMAQLW